MNKVLIDMQLLPGAEKFLPKDDAVITGLEVLESGMTNKNYLCTTVTGNKYVVRVPGVNTSEIINRQHEWSNHHKIARLKLNVEHVSYLEHSWIKTSVFIKDKFPDLIDAEIKIDMVCRSLKKLHHSKIIFDNDFWAGKMIGIYEKVAAENGIKLEEDYYKLRASLKEKYDDYLYSNINWAPCHNDLVKENILWDGARNVYLIDWEYSGMNDPLWDVSSYILENGLNADEEACMLQRYFSGEPARKDIHKIVSLFKIYQDVLWYVWAKIRTFHGCEYSEYATGRIDRAIEHYTAI
ncbi:phosphotransferase [Chitinophaga sp. YIM B06452]|uniref:phosphotransferase n=1 Tax=Chitinophaga sp. YIM B06452 TaxID=3082158 RepID=UPI0031FED70C